MNTVINFSTAKLLKEKGFERNVGYSKPYYNHLGELNGDVTEYVRAQIHDEDTTPFETTPVPTIAEVVMWSFNTHKIWITVDVNINGKFNYLLRQFNSKDRAWEVRNPSSIKEYFNNPDDAYSSGITYFLNNLI